MLRLLGFRRLYSDPHLKVDLESPGVGVEAFGRSAESHDGHAARQSAG